MSIDKTPDFEFARPYSFDADSSTTNDIIIRLFCASDININDSIAGKYASEIAQQTLYWNDDSCHHWFFDFKLSDGTWASCLSIEDNGDVWNVEIHS